MNVETNIDRNFKRKYDPKTGLEVYDFITGEKAKPRRPVVSKTSDNWAIFIYDMTENGSFYKEYSPSNEFIICTKRFDAKGKLREERYTIQESLYIGVWKYYDEEGKLEKTINYNERLDSCKVKLDDVFNILEKEGWIDRKTGNGGTKISITDKSASAKPGFGINILKNTDGRDIWTVAKSSPGSISNTLTIDANTGEITRKQTISRGYQ